MTLDPMAFRAGIEPDPYVTNNPANATDPGGTYSNQNQQQDGLYYWQWEYAQTMSNVKQQQAQRTQQLRTLRQQQSRLTDELEETMNMAEDMELSTAITYADLAAQYQANHLKIQELMRAKARARAVPQSLGVAVLDGRVKVHPV